MFFSGCILPMRIVEPIDTRVIDADTGKQLDNVDYLRISCDVHDFSCSHALLEKGISHDGNLQLDGKRQWGLWMPVPGGVPVPNHQIAVWKDGYYAFVFSQYDRTIDEFARRADRADIRIAVEQVPKERKYLYSHQNPNDILLGGVIRLFPLSKAN